MKSLTEEIEQLRSDLQKVTAERDGLKAEADLANDSLRCSMDAHGACKAELAAAVAAKDYLHTCNEGGKKLLSAALEEICEYKAEQEALVAAKDAAIFTVVSTIEGTDYEGFPTSEINYLQRLRILVEKEQELNAIRESERKLRDALSRSHSLYCGCDIMQDGRPICEAMKALRGGQ